MIKGLQTPALGCLFTPNISTWDWFGDDVTPGQRWQSQDWYSRQWPGMANTRYALCLMTSFGAGTPRKINLFRNGYGSRLDFRKIDVVLDQAEMIHNAGALLVPTLFNDDRTVCFEPISRQEQVISQLVSLFRPFIKIWCIGLEATEYLSLQAISTFYQIFKEADESLAVGIHAQWDFDRSPNLPRCDVLFYEHPWSPVFGDNHTAEETKQVGADVLARCTQQGIACVFSEYNTNINGSRIREQTRALLELNPAGVGGPT